MRNAVKEAVQSIVISLLSPIPKTEEKKMGDCVFESTNCFSGTKIPLPKTNTNLNCSPQILIRKSFSCLYR